MKQIPHVVLMLGPHVRGSEVAVKRVLASEKPSRLLFESLGDKHNHARYLEDLRRDAPNLIHHEFDDLALSARLYLLAKEHGIPFELAEPAYDAEAFSRITSKISAYQTKFEGAVNLVTTGGKFEEALQLVKESIRTVKEAQAERDLNLIENISKQANLHGTVAAFLGQVHISIVRKLTENGAKVTVYYSGGTFPASNALPQRSNLPQLPVHN
jgi:hypothetical protein